MGWVMPSLVPPPLPGPRLADERDQLAAAMHVSLEEAEQRKKEEKPLMECTAEEIQEASGAAPGVLPRSARSWASCPRVRARLGASKLVMCRASCRAAGHKSECGVASWQALNPGPGP